MHKRVHLANITFTTITIISLTTNIDFNYDNDDDVIDFFHIYLIHHNYDNNYT
jgi:hypothetical protein